VSGGARTGGLGAQQWSLVGKPRAAAADPPGSHAAPTSGQGNPPAGAAYGGGAAEYPFKPLVACLAGGCGLGPVAARMPADRQGWGDADGNDGGRINGSGGDGVPGPALQHLLQSCRRGAFDHAPWEDSGDDKGGAVRGEGLVAMRRPVLGQVWVQEGRELAVAAALVLANAQAWSSRVAASSAASALDDAAILDQLLAEFDSPDGLAAGRRLSALLARSCAATAQQAAREGLGEPPPASSADAAAGASGGGQAGSRAAAPQAGLLVPPGRDSRRHGLAHDEAGGLGSLAHDEAGGLGSTRGCRGDLRLGQAASLQGDGEDARRHAGLSLQDDALAPSRPALLIQEPPLTHSAVESSAAEALGGEVQGAATVGEDDVGEDEVGPASTWQPSLSPASSRGLSPREKQGAGRECSEISQGAPAGDCASEDAREAAAAGQPPGVVPLQGDDAPAPPAAVPAGTRATV